MKQIIHKAVKGVFVTLGLLAMAGTAYAIPVTFDFRGSGADRPISSLQGSSSNPCNDMITGSISGSDLCETKSGAGFDYSKSGLSVSVTADNDTGDALLMQDLQPKNSGLAVLSPGDNGSDDQVQVKTGESILFDFGSRVDLLGFDFNNGRDKNCRSTDLSEGSCGFFDLFVDTTLVGNFAAVDDLDFFDLYGTIFSGTTFKVAHIGNGDLDDLSGGFAIGSVTAQVPEPGTLGLVGLGLIGLAARYRRRS